MEWLKQVLLTVELMSQFLLIRTGTQFPKDEIWYQEYIVAFPILSSLTKNQSRYKIFMD